jgi:hypothetical protein
MERRQFLQSTLAFGAVGLLPDSFQNNELVKAVAKHFPDGEWKFVQNQDEEIPPPTERIWDAALGGRWHIVKEWLRRDPSLISAFGEPWITVNDEEFRYDFGCSPLLYLAIEQHADIGIVKYLVSLGINGTGLDHWGCPSLHHAAGCNPSVEILQYLISMGADVNARDDRRWTPLHYAAELNHDPNVLKYLISQGADVSARDSIGKIPLDLAYREPHIRILRKAMGLE